MLGFRVNMKNAYIGPNLIFRIQLDKNKTTFAKFNVCKINLNNESKGFQGNIAIDIKDKHSWIYNIFAKLGIQLKHPPTLNTLDTQAINKKHFWNIGATNSIKIAMSFKISA